MTTGPELFGLSLQWATDAETYMGSDQYARAAAAAAVAQSYATLALAAATALASTGVGGADLGEWSALICESDDPDEAFVDVADAERYAQRDEYVNDGVPSAAEQTARDYEAHEANEAWLDAHPDEFVDEDAETENGYTGEQLNGNACSVCGGDFKTGEALQLSGYVLDHGQLFAHTACLDESGS